MLIFSVLFFKFKKSLFLLTLIILSSVIFSSYFYEKFKLYDLREEKFIKNQEFFSFRLVSLIGAYKLIKDKPLGGYGHNKHFRRQMEYHRNQDWGNLKLPDQRGSQLSTIHNEFLRLYLATGLFTFLFLILFLTIYIFQTIKISGLFNNKNEEVSNFSKMCLINIFAMCLVSLTGYYTFFGSFLNQNIFWAAAGSLFALYNINTYKLKTNHVLTST